MLLRRARVRLRALRGLHARVRRGQGAGSSVRRGHEPGALGYGELARCNEIRIPRVGEGTTESARRGWGGCERAV